MKNSPLLGKSAQLKVSVSFSVQTTRRRFPLNPKSATFAFGTRRMCHGGELSVTSSFDLNLTGFPIFARIIDEWTAISSQYWIAFWMANGYQPKTARGCSN